MPVLGIFKAVWVIVIFLFLFVWVPGRLFARKANTAYAVWVAGNFVRMLACVAAVVLVLTGIKALGSITAVLAVVAALVIAWLRNHQWQVRGVIATVQNKTLNLVHKVESKSLTEFDQPSASKPITFRIPGFFQPNFWLALLANREVLIAGFVLVVIASAALLWQNPAQQLRYEHVEQYSVLLRARQFALNLQPIGQPFVVPAALVATSLISAVDLAQVTRFLSPMIGIFLVVALGLFVRISTRTGAAAIVAMYCLGAAALPPPPPAIVPVAATLREKLLALFDYAPSVTRPGPEFALGMILLLLGLAFLADWQRDGGWDSLIDVVCCLALVSVISQYLLVAFLVAGAAMLLAPLVGIIVLFVLLYGTAIYATLVTSTFSNDVFAVLPLAAAITAACFVAFLHSTLTPLVGKRADAIVLGVCLLLAVVWFRPNRMVGQFLEYEEAAQQTRVINQTLPRQRWVVIAPVEQLPETFGFGGYDDLALWVQKYKDQVSEPDFHFKDAPQDMLIYVEKIPFQMYESEPAMVSFATLTDATYRNYRSPAGRASLESEALQVCESYRANHSDMTTFYEDENLRIYRIHTPPKPSH